MTTIPALPFTGNQLRNTLTALDQAITEVGQTPGPPGEDGREIELQVTATHVQWRYAGTPTWTNLVPLSAITGPAGTNGTNGTNGQNLELRTTATHVQWRVVGSATWTDLVALALITGPAGTNGVNGVNGVNGSNGREVQLQTSSTHVQWRYAGDTTWTNLVALSVITGPAGPTGANGQNIELQTSQTHIQWRVVGATSWTNLASLASLTGPQGPAGQAGTPGPAATIDIGTITTGAPGTSASVNNVGTSSAALLNFTIPRGSTGEAGTTGPAGPAGAAATIQVGTITTGAAGSSANVANSGTPSAAVFNFTIPRGDTGATGATGPQGPAGQQPPLSSAAPANLAATAAAGTSGDAARIDHVHQFQAITAIIPLTAPTGTIALGELENYQMPEARTLVAIPVWSVKTAPTGLALQFDIRVGGTSIFSTLPTIAAGGTSSSATTPAVFSTEFEAASRIIAANSLVTWHCTQVGSGGGTGAKCAMFTRRAS